MTLTDTDKMPFGKYEGTLMQDIPCHYLHWYFGNVNSDAPKQKAVREYILNSLNALKLEDKDLIWKMK